jgi:hypothetical protein
MQKEGQKAAEKPVIDETVAEDLFVETVTVGEAVIEETEAMRQRILIR